MNTLHQLLRSTKLTGLAILAMLALAACDTVQPDAGDDLDQATADEASAVVAEALSDQYDGLMADLYDLTGEVGEDGISYAGDAAAAKGSDDRPWRGRHRSYTRTYNPETGEHTVTYDREVTTPNFEKSVAAELIYVFEDADGGFIEFPRAQRDAVATITFEGARSGEAMGSAGRSGREYERSFEREASWTLSGVNTAEMTLAGEQSHSGTRSRSVDGAVVASSVSSLRFVTDDVVISTAVAEDGTLERAVTGTLQVTGRIERMVNGNTIVREIEATVELEGNGRALLRFMGFPQPYRVNLDEGSLAS